MTDYVGNSNKDKDEKKKDKEKAKIEPVVTGEVIQKKKSIGHTFKNVFFGGDFKVAMRFVASEVILPAVRDLLVNSISKATERVVYGDSNRQYNRPTNYTSRIQYNSPLRPQDPRGMARLPDQRPRSLVSGSKEAVDIIVASREEADLVVENMSSIIDMYEVASVADLNALLNLPSSHIDNKWGWTSMVRTEIHQVRQGWSIDFPRLEEI